VRSYEILITTPDPTPEERRALARVYVRTAKMNLALAILAIAVSSAQVSFRRSDDFVWFGLVFGLLWLAVAALAFWRAKRVTRPDPRSGTW
jgi:hypothetical protein